MPEPSSLIADATVQKFAALFNGRKDVYGLGGKGGVRRVPAYDEDNYWRALYAVHLKGEGPSIGVFPMLDGDVVNFAAIDLDEPDFDAARDMQEFLPGVTWIERSRSGNAHVWTFFIEPVEAWIPRGILRAACEAIGKYKVEVFPKQDKLLEGMVGNYINLPYYGDTRPVIGPLDPTKPGAIYRLAVDEFVEGAMKTRNDPGDWRKRARWLDISPPEEREEHSEWGTATQLHICAEHIIANRERNPVMTGHRNIVYFNLAKMLLHYEGFDRDEALYYMKLVNEASPDEIPEHEIEQILSNAERGRYTSTGCDDSLMGPYVHPDCSIANPK